MKTARILCVLVALWWGWFALPAAAVQVQFATPVQSMTNPYAPGASNAAPAPATSPAPMSPYPNPSPSNLSPTPSPPALLSPSPSPTYAQPGAAPGGAVAPYAPQPYTTPNAPPAINMPTPGLPGGTVQPPPTTWDPYATPGGTPSAAATERSFVPVAQLLHGRHAEIHPAHRPRLRLVRRQRRSRAGHQRHGAQRDLRPADVLQLADAAAGDAGFCYAFMGWAGIVSATRAQRSLAGRYAAADLRRLSRHGLEPASHALVRRRVELPHRPLHRFHPAHERQFPLHGQRRGRADAFRPASR